MTWKFMKKSFQETLKINLATGFFASYILPLDRSLNWESIHQSDYKGPAIFAIWHGNQYVNLSVPRKERHKHNLLISPSNDGDMIANVSKMLEFSLIRGSVKRRGAEAAREIIHALENGSNVSYTIDGPKGPIYKVKPGIIRLAQMSGFPIIPLMGGINARFQLPSWDKYHVPYHFAKGVAIYGGPIYIPKELSEEEIKEYQVIIEEKLLDLRDVAQEMVGEEELCLE